MLNTCFMLCILIPIFDYLQVYQIQIMTTVAMTISTMMTMNSSTKRRRWKCNTTSTFSISAIRKQWTRGPQSSYLAMLTCTQVGCKLQPLMQWYQRLSAKISKYKKQTGEGVVLIDFREQKSKFCLISLLKSLITKLVFVHF